MGEEPGSPETFFAGHADGLAIYRAVEQAIRDLGDAAVAVSKSQIAFRRRTGFAYVWRPAQYITCAVPAVLSIPLPTRLDSDRFTSVVHPSPSVGMHQLKLRSPGEVDEEVRGWLGRAYSRAG